MLPLTSSVYSAYHTLDSIAMIIHLGPSRMYLLDKIVEYGRKWLVEPLTSVFTGSRLRWKKRSSPYPDDSLPARKRIKTVDVATMTSDQLPEVGAIEEEIAVEAQDELAIVEEVPQPAQVLIQLNLAVLYHS